MYYHLDPTPQLRQILDKAYRSHLAFRMRVSLGQPLIGTITAGPC